MCELYCILFGKLKNIIYTAAILCVQILMHMPSNCKGNFVQCIFNDQNLFKRNSLYVYFNLTLHCLYSKIEVSVLDKFLPYWDIEYR